MILFNKLIRTDLLFMLAIMSLFFIKNGALKDGVLGFAAAVFVISIFNHISHYKSYKKFY
ncbi:MAG TPA: hypothetical protein VII28_13050 [Puia sp.]